MTHRPYSTPAAFKQALETRLKTASATGLDFGRRRQVLVFERFLARTVLIFGDAATLKGGLALELRLERARTTKDVDLRIVGAPTRALDRLQEAGRLDLGDFMAFEVQPDAEHPEIQSEGMQYEGMRFRAECRLAGKIYGQVFGVDVAFAEPMFGDPEIVVADDTLAFAGLAPPRLRLYPVETHIAEKLHAYTMPRGRPSTGRRRRRGEGVLGADPRARGGRSSRRVVGRRVVLAAKVMLHARGAALEPSEDLFAQSDPNPLLGQAPRRASAIRHAGEGEPLSGVPGAARGVNR